MKWTDLQIILTQELLVNNNTSFNNNRHGFIFRTNTNYDSADQGVFTNNISIRHETNPSPDYISGNIDPSNIFYELNEIDSQTGAYVNHFITVVLPTIIVDGELVVGFERDENNNITYSNFLSQYQLLR